MTVAADEKIAACRQHGLCPFREACARGVVAKNYIGYTPDEPWTDGDYNAYKHGRLCTKFVLSNQITIEFMEA